MLATHRGTPEWNEDEKWEIEFGNVCTNALLLGIGNVGINRTKDVVMQT